MVRCGRGDAFCGPVIWSQSVSEPVPQGVTSQVLSVLPPCFDETGRVEEAPVGYFCPPGAG